MKNTTSMFSKKFPILSKISLFQTFKKIKLCNHGYLLLMWGPSRLWRRGLSEIGYSSSAFEIQCFAYAFWAKSKSKIGKKISHEFYLGSEHFCTSVTTSFKKVLAFKAATEAAPFLMVAWPNPKCKTNSCRNSSFMIHLTQNFIVVCKNLQRHTHTFCIQISQKKEREEKKEFFCLLKWKQNRFNPFSLFIKHEEIPVSPLSS